MKEEIMKILLDRENHLKSDLTIMKYVKLTKTIDYDKIALLEERIKELYWVKEKIVK